jgi:hypothetical protein
MEAHEALLDHRSGAGDESTRSDYAGDELGDRLLSGSRDHWYQLSADAAVEAALGNYGYEGLLDRRRVSPHRNGRSASVAGGAAAYRKQYFDFNVRHFHEKLVEQHNIQLSYTWVKTALQMAGLVKRARKRGKHRKPRERRPLPG